jgi:hypothetical protein
MPREINDSGIVERDPPFLKQWVLRPIVFVLDRIWIVFGYVVGAVIVGGILVNIFISLITTGTLGLTDPRTWAVMRVLLTQPVYGVIGLSASLILIFFAYLGHRVRSRKKKGKSGGQLRDIYGLAPVVSAEPSNQLIPSFNPDIYISRLTADTHLDADEIARTALHDALRRRDPMSHDSVYGFCVFGRKLLGTSRLAWEAMKHDAKHDRELSK